MLALTITSSIAITACPRPSPYGSLVASRGASTMVGQMQSALHSRRGAALVGLVTERCLRHCHGFTFVPKGQDGKLHRFDWRQRSGSGTLADDLYGQLQIFKSVTKAQVTISSLTFDGRRRATLEVALSVDGLLKDGARRSDRGLLRLDLRQNVDGTWRIDGFTPTAMATVVSTTSLFTDASNRLGALRRGVNARARGNLAAIGADQGPGLAVGDLNGDGRLDLFLPGPRLGVLHLGDGKGGFDAGTAMSGPGVGHHAVLGDADNDGDLDVLVLTRRTSPVLLENNAGKLTPARTAGLTGLAPARAATWLDADGDGKLDLLLAPTAGPGGKPKRPRLLLRRSAGFQDAARLPRFTGHFVDACAGDLNGDGRTDLVLVDALGPIRILLNGKARFRAALTGKAPSLGRACAIADLDTDGALDVLVAAVGTSQAWKYNQAGFPLPGSPFRKPKGLRARLSDATQGSFWLRNSPAGFSRQPLGVPAQSWDLAVAATDVDNDGRVDVVLAGGHHGRSKRSADERFFTLTLPRLLLGKPAAALTHADGSLGVSRGATLLLGHKGGRTDVGIPAGLSVASGVRAAAWADLDRDGTPELLLRLQDGSLRQWRWSLRRGRHLTLRLASKNTASAGATVTAWALEKRCSVNLGAAPAGEVQLGLGTAVRADKVEIRWPDGTRQVVQDLNTRAGYTVHKGSADPAPGLAATRAPPPARPTTAPTPPARPGVIAGLNLAELGLLNVLGPKPKAKAAPLRFFYGSRATIVLLTTTPCPACKPYARKLAKLGWKQRTKGVAILEVSATTEKRLRGLTRLRFAPGTKAPPGTLSRLLVLDKLGRPKVVYLGKLPDPLVLLHHLTRILAD